MRVLNMKIRFSAAVYLFVAFLGGCGGATNNDQGVSFTFLGYKDECEGSDDERPNAVGVTVPLTSSFETGAAQRGGGVIAGMVVQNNLTSQFVRTENAFFSYYIPGASVQPPATSSVLGAIVPEASSVEGEEGADATVEPSRGCGETFVVPAEVITWMALNRNSLPELPFTMEVRGYISGITSAGDRIDTNEIKFLVQFVPDIIITPPSDDDDDTGDEVDTGDDTDTDTGTDDGTEDDTAGEGDL